VHIRWVNDKYTPCNVRDEISKRYQQNSKARLRFDRQNWKRDEEACGGQVNLIVGEREGRRCSDGRIGGR